MQRTISQTELDAYLYARNNNVVSKDVIDAYIAGYMSSSRENRQTVVGRIEELKTIFVQFSESLQNTKNQSSDGDFIERVAQLQDVIAEYANTLDVMAETFRAIETR